MPERLRCSLGLAKAAEGTRSVEDAARRFCEFFHDELVDAAGDHACALVRFYITQPYSRLPADLQEFARSAAGAERIGGDTRCLTLLGTSGAEPAWQSRFTSKSHRVIPLMSAEMVEKAPMISRLISAFGLDVRDVVGDSGSIVRDLGGKTYGVFYVPEAKGSPYIPAQAEFVEPYGIKSVIGAGAALASGELFAIVLFTRVHVQRQSADRFRALALDAKAGLLRFSDRQIFENPPANAGRI